MIVNDSTPEVHRLACAVTTAAERLDDCSIAAELECAAGAVIGQLLGLEDRLLGPDVPAEIESVLAERHARLIGRLS